MAKIINPLQIVNEKRVFLFCRRLFFENLAECLVNSGAWDYVALRFALYVAWRDEHFLYAEFCRFFDSFFDLRNGADFACQSDFAGKAIRTWNVKIK